MNIAVCVWIYPSRLNICIEKKVSEIINGLSISNISLWFCTVLVAPQEGHQREVLAMLNLSGAAVIWCIINQKYDPWAGHKHPSRPMLSLSYHNFLSLPLQLCLSIPHTHALTYLVFHIWHIWLCLWLKNIEHPAPLCVWIAWHGSKRGRQGSFPYSLNRILPLFCTLAP